MTYEVKPRSTALGDWVYAHRHREYAGVGGVVDRKDRDRMLPVTDADCLMYERGTSVVEVVDAAVIQFDRMRPRAVVEIKHWRWHPTEPSASLTVLRDVANRLGVPFVIGQHTDTCDVWRIYSANKRAKQAGYGDFDGEVSELVWVEALYKMRGRELPPESADWIVANPVESRPWYQEIAPALEKAGLWFGG